MNPLYQYITEALKPISTNLISTWRQKVAKPDYYHQELTENKYLRPLVNALIGNSIYKVNRKRYIEDFIEMYFGNYMQAKDGSFTLARVKDVEYSGNNKSFKVVITVMDKWFSGLLARFTFKLNLSDPAKYQDEKKPEGTADLVISIETPVYKNEKELTWTKTRTIAVKVPATIPQNDPVYMDLAKQLSNQTRDMNWGYYDPVKNRFSQE